MDRNNKFRGNKNYNSNRNKHNLPDKRRDNNRQTKPEFVQTLYDIPSLNNSLSTISFCDKECYNLNQNTTKDKLIRYIEGKYPIKIIDKQFVIINPRILYNISKHEHIITTLTNGNPYLLFLTVIDDVKWCIFIDRKLKNGYTYPKIHCTQYDFADELFKRETVFNGELVRDVNRHWKFIIGDILVYKGEYLKKKKNFLSRIELLHSILDKEYRKNNDIEICPLQIKRLFQYSQIAELFDNFMPDLSYTCRGLVFNTMNPRFTNYAWILPKEQQIRVRTMNDEEAELGFVVDANKTFVKARDVFSANMTATIPDSRYIDKMTTSIKTLKKSAVPDIYELVGDTDLDNDIAYIPNYKISSMLYNYFKKHEEKINVEVNCIYHNYFKRWIPVEIVA
jgi:hypothetical protein